MPDTLYDELQSLGRSQPVGAALDRLIEALREQGRHHKLFDALLLKKKAELGLPVSRPAALTDVPQEQRKLVEETYIAAAREVGGLFLAAGDIPNAWMYLQVIREPEPVRAAIEALSIPQQTDDATEQVLRIALYDGVHPTQGLRMMLKLHGTCSTITALDQALANLPQPERRACARIMTQELYRDLRDNVERQVRQRIAVLPPELSLRELIAGRDWLFEGGNYHIDVSHLGAVVRFARALEEPAELDLALQLAEYGGHLDPQLQYGNEPPFDDFYAAHKQFYRALLDQDRDAALGYFEQRLEQEPDERDKPVLAYVLVDLLMRSGRLDAAVDIAARHLVNLSEDVSISFFDLCLKAGRIDTLLSVQREQDDPVAFAAALVAQSRAAAP